MEGIALKVRMGFITNSSSTNFLIISKRELTEKFIFDQLGFRENTPLSNMGHDLCEYIVKNADMNLRYYDYVVPTYENIKEVFGPKSAEKFKEKSEKGFYTYWGYTSSDDGGIESFFTTDSFEIDNADLYINARACVW